MDEFFIKVSETIFQMACEDFFVIHEVVKIQTKAKAKAKAKNLAGWVKN